MVSTADTTRMLLAAQDGDGDATSRLMEVLYSDLHRVAERLQRGERVDHTLQPTALVHEAFLRLIDQSRVAWQGRAHFLSLAARMMRRILVDHARGKRAAKRDAGAARISLDTAALLPQRRATDVLALDAALADLAALSPRQGQCVEMVYFGGMSVAEVSQVLSLSERTVARELRVARAWLLEQLRA